MKFDDDFIKKEFETTCIRLVENIGDEMIMLLEGRLPPLQYERNKAIRMVYRDTVEELCAVIRKKVNDLQETLDKHPIV